MGTLLTVELYTYKWLFFLVAAFIFLRFLSGSANNLWLENQKYERARKPKDDRLILVGFFWITLFGSLGAYLCYAGGPLQFFWRAFFLLSATVVGSTLQWLAYAFGWTSPIGRWGDWWTLVNGTQLAAVVVLWQTDVLGSSWSTRLSILAIVSGVILIVDFYWQLKQVAKQEPTPARSRSDWIVVPSVLVVLFALVLLALSSDSGFELLALVLLVLVLLLLVLFARFRAAEEGEA